MFSGAKNFNQPIDSWDLSNLESYERMFLQATSFGQNLPEGMDPLEASVELGKCPQVLARIANATSGADLKLCDMTLLIRQHLEARESYDWDLFNAIDKDFDEKYREC
ncbi:MAG: hypothetical protein SGILL_003625 [Bacillariaceae sp.]